MTTITNLKSEKQNKFAIDMLNKFETSMNDYIEYCKSQTNFHNTKKLPVAEKMMEAFYAKTEISADIAIRLGTDVAPTQNSYTIDWISFSERGFKKFFNLI